MKTAKEIFDLGIKAWERFDVRSLLPALRVANNGAIEDVLNINGCRYYQWSSALVKELKFFQIVELGGAMGVWDLCVLHTLPQDCKLYSITLEEHGLEFSYVVDKYPNFIPVVGDDLDLNSWPLDLDFINTDFWYFDSLHTEEQLRKELDLYSPFFKSGAIVLFDDIYLNDGMERVWNDLKKGKYGQLDCFDATNPLHWSGYGICCVL